MQKNTLPDASLDLSVVVPCYNEASTLSAMLPRLMAACKNAAEEYEIILVNDGSVDASWALIDGFAKNFPRVVGVNLARRYGQQIALSAGLSLCRGKRILIIDADLQDPPELLPEMMRLMDRGADVIYGQRKRRTGENFFKRMTAACFYRLIRLAGETPLPVDTGDFRLINRRVLELLQQMPERQRYLRGMIAWMGLNQEPLLYERQQRFAGKSGYSLKWMLRFAMDAFTGFSVFPLRLSLWLGFVCGLLALGLLGYVLFAWISGDAVPGWTSLSCIMLFFFGLQFFCIGIIGEYVGRIYTESKQRPLFIIERISKNGARA
ncbi:MAG: glycosyltransferase family 2 protein [Alphaproteobacteria bacterium]|nr:glycosyltransferase family 2 protein [Alphaproteobacteria bacterium]